MIKRSCPTRVNYMVILNSSGQKNLQAQITTKSKCEMKRAELIDLTYKT